MKYKGELEGFPEEIVEKMLERQVEQGNKRDVTVFENDVTASVTVNGFTWALSLEGMSFWENVIRERNFQKFFRLYPKKTEETYMKYMFVDDKPIMDEKLAARRFVIGKINGEYISVEKVDYNERCDEPIECCFWKYAKEIEEKDTVVTIPEIAKLTGTPVHLIRIKK